jgi:hypothetical protein
VSPTAAAAAPIAVVSDSDDAGAGLGLAGGVPIQSLGPLAYYLTAQQRASIVDMYRCLLPGVLVVKHGRAGRPKQMSLLCDAAMEALQWRELGGGGSDEVGHGVSAAASGGGDGSVKPAVAAPVLSAPGPKVRRSSMFASLNVFGSGGDGNRSLLLRDIVEVRGGSELVAPTDVMRRALSKGYVQNPSRVISVVTKDRTLDFEMDEVRTINSIWVERVCRFIFLF